MRGQDYGKRRDLAREEGEDKKNLRSLAKRGLVITVMTITAFGLTELAFDKITKVEEERCWHVIEDSAQAMNKEITIRFEDNINMLRIASRMMVQADVIDSHSTVLEHINSFYDKTIFKNIEVLYPDGTLLFQTGKSMNVSDVTPFKELAEKGEHISNRTTDLLDKKSKVVRYYVPIVENEKTVAMLVGGILSNSLEKREHQDVLERLSYEDALTEMNNRNKFEQVIEWLKENKPQSIGIAYIDLNGLKLINDKFGHKAGDELIKKAAKNISYVFGKKAFRIGGDEFIIIASNVAQDSFEKDIEQVVSLMKEDEVSISIGISWTDANIDILLQIHEADEQMYENKKKYYENNAVDRRRAKR